MLARVRKRGAREKKLRNGSPEEICRRHGWDDVAPWGQGAVYKDESSGFGEKGV